MSSSSFQGFARIALDAVLVAGIHVALIASGGLFEGVGPLVAITSVLTHAGWFLLLRAVCEVVAGSFGKARIAGFLFVLTVAASWLIFLAKWARSTGFEERSGVYVGMAVAVVLVEVLGILRSHREWTRPAWRPTAAILLLGIALVLAAPRLVPPPTSSGEDLVENRFEELRPEASRRFAVKPWNLLLITVDTLRADHLGTYGYPLPTSPTIDSLAVAGIQIQNAVTVRPKTSPSFASLLTGTYPSRHGIHAPAMVLDESLTTLSERLAALGLRTGASITNGNLAPDFGFDQGYGSFEWGLTDAAAVTDRGLEWLEGLEDPDAPWHLWVHYTDPHTPYDPPRGYTERFLDLESDRPAAREIAAYDGEIFYTDEEIGRLLAWLHERPEQSARTLIVFTADHGESLGEHDYWFEHGLHPYEASSHVPLIVVAPGVVAAGSRSDALISNVDVVPTLMDAFDAPVEEGLGGRSFLPLLAGLSDDGPRNFAYIEAGYGEHIGPGRTRALRRRSGKSVDRLVDWALWPRSPLDLVWGIDARLEGGLDGPERYDLTMDPDETNNLAPDPFTEEELLRLRAIAERMGSGGFAEKALRPEDIDPESLRSLRALGYIE